MLKKKKIKTIFILVIVVFTTLIVFLFYKKETPKLEKNLSPFPNIDLPSYIENKYNISFDRKNINFIFPKELPYLEKQILPPLTKDEAYLIATRLGFNNDPLDVKDALKGEILIWNSESNFLTITLRERKIKYGPNYNPIEKINDVINKNLSEEEMFNIAQNFLKEKFVSYIINPSPSSLVYLRFEEGLELFQETEKENFQIIQFNFNDGDYIYPILTSNPQATNIYVQLLKDGTVINMETTLLSKITESSQKFPLKNYDEIIAEASNAKIVSINNGNENLSDIKSEDIKNISINNINIAYYLEKQSDEYFQPIYVLEGNVLLKNIPQELPISLYLTAFK